MAQAPSITLQGPSLDGGDAGLPTEVLTKIGSKSIISRSNSAPQAQNRFSLLRSNGKSHGGEREGITSVVSGSPHNSPVSPLAVLSDGVVDVDRDQAASAAATVVRAASMEAGDCEGGSGSVYNKSQVPLCDWNHSPSSTRRYYNNQNTTSPTSDVFTEDPHPEDVWQRQTSTTVTKATVVVSSSAPNSSSSCFTQHSNGDHNGIPERGSLQRSDAVCDSPRDDTAHASSGEEVANLESPTVRTQRRQVRHSQSEVLLPSDMQRKMSLASVGEKGYARLQEELMKAQKALEMKDEEVDELRGIRERLMKEVSDFTASLFEEVNSQLNEAALSEQHAKKQLVEANHKIEMLTAERDALKRLVLTSTPSAPNKHLHPQINNKVSPTSNNGSGKKEKGGRPFWMTHRRSTSHHQYTKESREKEEASQHHAQLKEMDTGAYEEFARWRLQPTLEMNSQFFTRVQQDDIQPCLNFKNCRLADKLQQSVRENTLSIEPIPGDHSYPRKCCLSETHKLCNYKIRFEGDSDWYSISQMSRNRIAAVCDFYCYVRYIVQGLVKCSDKDMFAELVRLRHRMAQARLGII